MLNKIVILIVVVAFLYYRVQFYFLERREKAVLQQWLIENDLREYEAKLHRFGINSKPKFAQLDAGKFLTLHGSFWNWFTFSSEKERLERLVERAKNELQLEFWLQELGLADYLNHFMSHGITNVNSLVRKIQSGKVKKVIDDESVLNLLKSAVEQLNNPDGPGSLHYRGAAAIFSFSWWSFKLFVKAALLMVLCVVSLSCLCIGLSKLKMKSRLHRTSVIRYLIGLALNPQFTTVEWEWTDPHVVGETMSFSLKFFRLNLFPYLISQNDHVLIEIMHNNKLIATSCEYGGQTWSDMNKMRVTFTVREAGNYTIAVLAHGRPIRGSPFKKTFLPGVVDPSKCSILEGASLLVVQQGIYTPLTVEARDKFGNVCPLSDQNVQSYGVEVTEIGSSVRTDPELVIFPDDLGKNNVLHIKLEEEGCFNAVIKYNGTDLTQGLLTVLSLNAKEAEQVHKNINKQCWNVWYEAHLWTCDKVSPTATPILSNRGGRAHSVEYTPLMTAALDTSGLKMSRKVYCYISHKYLTIKEFYMKIIPHRLYSFRVRPTTKIILHPPDRHVDQPFFTVDDGSQPPVTITCKERNVLVATFSKLLLSKIGGSESFNDKRDFFYRELLSHHGRKDSEVRLRINREKLLESSYQACKSLYFSDWLRCFNITFKDEQGLDWGGLRREWFELLCKALFAHESGFFRRFNADDPQALVHPNPKRPPGLKLKFYEFAGRVVGKCLYESALGPTRRQNVKARFTRSFLAQLLGLRVSYRYFESDDKELYRSKIKYLEETDPEDLGLVFAEEEYNQEGQLEKLVELKPGGSQIAVTEANKKEYLDLLAQYRLTVSVKQEVEAFAKGLSELIPDNLLSVFDEYELELLMCGTGNISVADLRDNHSVIGFGRQFTKSLDWFWTIVTSFTQEELARLVQFITGSSQLPPGGFSELMPRLQISSAPTVDSLPTAHTCFNQICLPGYSSFEEMQKKLLLAINEGSEGFGFA